MVLLASQAKEEKKVTRESQVCLYQDQVEEMEPQGLLDPLDPLDSQATQMALWSVSLDHLETRVLPGLQDTLG